MRDIQKQAAETNTTDLGPIQSPRSATSWRAIALGSILTAIHVVCLLYLEEFCGVSGPSRITPSRVALISTAVCILFWLIVLNGLYRRFRPNTAFVQGELLTIFSMISIGSTIAASDMIPVLVHLMMEGTHSADNSNGYATKVLPFLTDWAHVSDPAAIKLFYQGHSSLFANNHYKLFVAPFFWWSICIFCFLLLAFCANTIMRRQWSRNEHLNFPITQLPVAMTSPHAGGLLSNRLFQVGFAIAGGLTLLNGIHFLYPTIPNLPITDITDVRWWIKDPVWDAMDWTPVNFYPFAIGMAFIIPLDLLFSLWFFTWVWKAERMASVALGIPYSPWTLSPGWPYYAHQMIGVWLSLLGISLWTARAHLRGVLKQVLRPGTGIDDSTEGIRYRTAVIGIGIGVIGMIGFFIAVGITPFIVIPYILMMLGYCVVIARVRAELGPPIQDMTGSGPDRIIATFAGPFTFGARSWLNFKIFTFWMHRESSTTYPSGMHMDALRLGEIGGGLNRRYWITLLLVCFSSGLLAFWADLYFGFHKGRSIWGGVMGQCGATCGWNGITASLEDLTSRPNWAEIIAMFVGSGFTFALYIVRGLGINMPLHPIAYLLTVGTTLPRFWLPMLIAWIIKLTVLRYGGLALYRRVLPFFFGLIVGQFVIGVGWFILGMILGIRTFTFYA